MRYIYGLHDRVSDSFMSVYLSPNPMENERVIFLRALASSFVKGDSSPVIDYSQDFELLLLGGIDDKGFCEDVPNSLVASASGFVSFLPRSKEGDDVEA